MKYQRLGRVLAQGEQPALFYTYVFWEQKGLTWVPRYVGKGNGTRYTGHIKVALSEGKKKLPWHRKLAKMIRENRTYCVTVVREGIQEDQAFGLEINLIARWKRLKDGGPLYNMTDGGEGATGLKFSTAVLEALRDQTRRLWKDPVRRAERLRSRNTPEARARTSKAKKKNWNDPVFREKAIASMEKMRSSPACAAMRSKSQKDLWSDPAYRNKQIKAQKAGKSSPAAKANSRAALLICMNRPGVQERRVASFRATWAKRREKAGQSIVI